MGDDCQPSQGDATSQVQKAEVAYQDFRVQDALEAALVISNRGNLYMEEVAPWSAFKKVCYWCQATKQSMW